MIIEKGFIHNAMMFVLTTQIKKLGGENYENAQ